MLEQLGTIHPLLPPGVGLLALLAGAVSINLFIRWDFVRTERKQNQETVLETLADLFLMRGPPDYIRSDNGAEFTATAVREWLHRLDVQTLFISTADN